jgi:uncharacterized protein (TIGR02646 family)
VRYIDQNSVTLPPDWQAKATRAYLKAKDLPLDERKQYIKKNYVIWKELKDELRKGSNGKCWYCESSISANSPGDVDHFRPKNKVEESPTHTGYWWLAFEWRNYRYSCELCNRINTDLELDIKGGKVSHFPLWDEAKRCYDEMSPDGILCEEPMLLDPVVMTDPDLLVFDETGMACPAFSETQAEKEYKRAKVSIEIYHLNRSHLKNSRKFLICDKVQQLIIDGDDFLTLYALDQTEAASKSFQRILDTLWEMIDKDAEYSSVALATLKLHCDADHEWIQDLLAAV